MSIGKNIAEFRKRKDYTQGQLGEILGVTNQAVSKWESEVSMPDIMLLPKIADALGVTLNDLYTIKENQPSRIVDYDEFPEAAQRMLINLLREFRVTYLVKAEKNPENGRYEHLETGYTYGCISDNAGVSFISDDLTIIDSGYGIINNGSLFENREIASGLKKLADPHVRKVLAFLYSRSFSNLETHSEERYHKEFCIDDVAGECCLTEEDTLEAVEKLISMHIITTSAEDSILKYIFVKNKAVEAAVTLRLVERMIRESWCWTCGPLISNWTEKQ